MSKSSLSSPSDRIRLGDFINGDTNEVWKLITMIGDLRKEIASLKKENRCLRYCIHRANKCLTGDVPANPREPQEPQESQGPKGSQSLPTLQTAQSKPKKGLLRSKSHNIQIQIEDD